jgi:FHS family glucose/mannose:H+ symporter-like MFS transporter
VTIPPLPPATRPPSRDVTWTGLVSFLLLGWSVLLVPSAIREVEGAFRQSDAGMGLAYLLNNLLYITGTLSVGWVAARLVRAPVLGAGPGLIAVGLGVVALAADWPLFLAGFLVLGLGAGLIDSGVNALFMDLYEGRNAGALNRLHLFFALGALASPLAMGVAISNSVPWQAVIAGTAVVALPIAAALATRGMPPVHADGAVVAVGPNADGPAASSTTPGWRTLLPVPLLVLAVAIAMYVASEIGVSNWLVRYLDEAPVAQATLALSLFWGGIALGRLVSSFIADRVGAVPYAVAWTSAAGLAIVASLLAPTIPVAIACFAIAGFAAGPAFPMIVAIGGQLFPGRSSLVSGVLVSAAMVGSIVYPPLMGVLSDAVGLRVGMFGAGLAMLISAGAILVASRLAHRSAVTSPVDDAPALTLTH